MSTGKPLVADHASTRDRVVEHVRRLIERGGSSRATAPSERDLALELGVSRPSVRSGLEALESMGVVVSRRGRGRSSPTAARPRQRAAEPPRLAPRLHPPEMFEARLVLEVGVAGLAAEHTDGSASPPWPRR